MNTVGQCFSNFLRPQNHLKIQQTNKKIRFIAISDIVENRLGSTAKTGASEYSQKETLMSRKSAPHLYPLFHVHISTCTHTHGHTRAHAVGISFRKKKFWWEHRERGIWVQAENEKGESNNYWHPILIVLLFYWYSFSLISKEMDSLNTFLKERKTKQ